MIASMQGGITEPIISNKDVVPRYYLDKIKNCFNNFKKQMEPNSEEYSSDEQQNTDKIRIAELEKELNETKALLAKRDAELASLKH